MVRISYQTAVDTEVKTIVAADARAEDSRRTSCWIIRRNLRLARTWQNMNNQDRLARDVTSAGATLAINKETNMRFNLIVGTVLAVAAPVLFGACGSAEESEAVDTAVEALCPTGEALCDCNIPGCPVVCLPTSPLGLCLNHCAQCEGE
jgi:hypothetical protein